MQFNAFYVERERLLLKIEVSKVKKTDSKINYNFVMNLMLHLQLEKVLYDNYIEDKASELKYIQLKAQICESIVDQNSFRIMSYETNRV